MSNIAAAFVKAKRAFGPALKDRTNPAFKSKYADLGACLDAVDDALLQNGIALMQETFEDSTGVTVETVFLHESGETLRGGKLHVPASKQDPQGYGSALTYARRYSLQAACGIAPEDDDGNAASKAKVKPVMRDAGGVISGPKEVLKALPPDWQAWLQDFAPNVDNAFEQQGPGAAQLLIDDQGLDNDCIAGLYALLSSKTRSALKAKPVAVAA
jgi:hypothetical protein